MGHLSAWRCAFAHLRAVASAVSPMRDDAPKMINLHDNNGTLRLSINTDALYYLESEDNYIKVHYKHNDRIVSYMLRSRTRTIEESLKGTSMMRCHRSYMVNVMKINHIKKGGKARYIVLTNEDIKPIPVSKSYFKNLIEKIDKYNNSASSSAAAAVTAPSTDEVALADAE